MKNNAEKKINDLYNTLPVNTINRLGHSIQFKPLATGGGSISVKYEDTVRLSRVQYISGKYQAVANRLIVKTLMDVIAEDYRECEGFEERVSKKGGYFIRLSKEDDMRSFLLTLAYEFTE